MPVILAFAVGLFIGLAIQDRYARSIIQQLRDANSALKNQLLAVYAAKEH